VTEKDGKTKSIMLSPIPPDLGQVVLTQGVEADERSLITGQGKEVDPLLWRKNVTAGHGRGLSQI